MKMFKRFGYILALALSVCGASFAQAAERVLGFAVVAFTDDQSAGVTKLNADLAYQAHAKYMYASRVSSDLTRDGHGYRQHSAMELPLNSPSPTAAA
jgi:hypothetical protein